MPHVSLRLRAKALSYEHAATRQDTSSVNISSLLVTPANWHSWTRTSSGKLRHANISGCPVDHLRSGSELGPRQVQKRLVDMDRDVLTVRSQRDRLLAGRGRPGEPSKCPAVHPLHGGVGDRRPRPRRL